MPHGPTLHTPVLSEGWEQLGSIGQVAAGGSPLGIAVTLVTLLNGPSQAVYWVGIQDCWFLPTFPLQLLPQTSWGAAGVGSSQNKHAERLSPENLSPKAKMGL